ncbi:MAG: hypothetical protein JXB48_24290 [Candidatus Latescibacteria bacterium]|nr:hypothetical protein [Candidatus Latescibacterota bacterium]
MAEFDIGQTFLDLKSTNLFRATKGKYFIAMSEADYDDDFIVCFVLNSENRIDRYKFGCNKKHNKFILEPSTFSFLTNSTSIMLSQPACYKLAEMYQSNIKLLDKADITLCRQIKNCIDWNYIPDRLVNLIKTCFKK